MEKYTLSKRVPKERYYEVFISADSNDGDYVYTFQEFSQEEFDNIEFAHP